jgi:hypothetical protein
MSENLLNFRLKLEDPVKQDKKKEAMISKRKVLAALGIGVATVCGLGLASRSG